MLIIMTAAAAKTQCIVLVATFAFIAFKKAESSFVMATMRSLPALSANFSTIPFAGSADPSQEARHPSQEARDFLQQNPTSPISADE